MEMHYERNNGHQYFVISEKHLKDDYRSRMLNEHSLPGFLSCHARWIDGEGSYCYEVTSKQPIFECMEHEEIDGRMLKMLLNTLLHCIHQANLFLLPMEGILMRPECIFANAGMSSFEFCYFPGDGEAFIKDLQQFGAYLLPKLKAEDKEAIQLGFSFYQLCNENRCNEDSLRELLRAGKSEEIFQQESSRSAYDAERERILDSFFREEMEEEEERPDQRRVILAAGILFALIAGILIAWKTKLEIGIGAALLVASGTGLFVRILERNMEGGEKEERNGGSEAYEKRSYAKEDSESRMQDKEARENHRHVKLPHEWKWKTACVDLISKLHGNDAEQSGSKRREWTANGNESGCRNAKKSPRRAHKPALDRSERDTELRYDELYSVEMPLENAYSEKRSTGNLYAKGPNVEDLTDQKNGFKIDEENLVQSVYSCFGYQHMDTSKKYAEADNATVLLGRSEKSSPHAALIEQGSGKIYALENEIHMLGKSALTADLILPSEAVSRIHAKLVRSGDGYELFDMRSRNGTFVNEAELCAGKGISLKDGDLTRFADVSMRYRINL